MPSFVRLCGLASPLQCRCAAGSDRRDARKLARLLRAGELKGIHIPDGRDEAVRDVCRARIDASQALATAKQQLSMFMLRVGRRYDGKTSWTQAHMNYLRGITLPDAAHQIVLEEYIAAVDAGVERVARLEAHMEDLLETWSRGPAVAALKAFRGFKTVAAMTVVSELGDLSRFESPRQLMGYGYGKALPQSTRFASRHGAGRSDTGGEAPPAIDHQDRQRPRPLDAHRLPAAKRHPDWRSPSR